jgi:hypothetical protein
MDELRIKGSVELAINGDENRIIKFNPNDLLFTERYYAMYSEFREKQKELEEKANELENGELDDNGMPTNIGKQIEFMKQTCQFVYEKIDGLFGPGTSQKVFGDALDFEMIGQFFEGITPYFNKVREGKVNRYRNTVTEKKNKHAMK